MFLSVFEMFKIGIGPSSSHTMGPMTAAGRFLDLLRSRQNPEPGAGEPAHVVCRFYGSLAWTGRGHASDRAVILGLSGHSPTTVDPETADTIIADVALQRSVAPPDLPKLAFAPDADIVFDYGPALPGHANGMQFECYDAAEKLRHQETYYSVGGGFVKTADELASVEHAPHYSKSTKPAPFAFATGAEMLAMGDEAGLTIAQMKRANERTLLTNSDLDLGLDRIWLAMNDCITRGIARQGVLPGGLGVNRRAAAIYEQLVKERVLNLKPPHIINDWICCYAMAVNEENAAGGRVVTAPTNGAAGVVPAVLKYYIDHCSGANTAGIRTFLLTAAAIGGLVKQNASISGAEVGCQGEVGSASAMAAAGLCAVLGGSNAQVENAAEIALEHHLGMTCDPVKGLVQVPCIERNGLGAVKAVAAASLSLRGDGKHLMPLDNCIAAMLDTGRDMDKKYKETSQGGLAVNLPSC
ncbi:MAG: L-serine ammonia-lyase [Hyphomicrobiaceae bacterium]